jgi:hypothetical protein
MRAFAMVAISTTFLLIPALANADPAHPEESATTGSPPAPGNVAPGTPATGERVVVHPATISNNLDEVVCTISPPATGTRLGGGRECHTEREWKRRQQESQDITRKAQTIGDTGVVRPP